MLCLTILTIMDAEITLNCMTIAAMMFILASTDSAKSFDAIFKKISIEIFLQI